MRLRTAASLVLITLLAACGGGGADAVGQPPVITTPTPPPPPASSGSTTFTASTSPTTVTLPSVGGFSGTLQMPAANTATSMSITVSTSPPSGAPILASRKASLQRLASSDTPLLYFSVTATTGVAFTGLPALTIALPNDVSPAQSFFAAAYIPGSGWTTFAGPALVQGSTVTLSSVPGSITMNAGTTIVFAFYAGSILNGSNPLTASPAQVQLLDLTQTQTVTLLDTYPGARLTLSGSSSCAGIANVSALSGSSFTVSAVSQGICSVTVSDNYSDSLVIPISVTSTSVVIQ